MEMLFLGVRNFRYGSSTANQRIEAWWRIIRESRANWWINYFKDMIDECIFDSSISYHVEAICFIWVSYRMSSMKVSVYGIVTL